MLNFNDISSARTNMNRFYPETLSEQTKTDGNHRVLIFGNDKDIRLLLRTMLELWNYKSEEAATVEEAVHHAAHKSFDIVLMDTKLHFSDSFAEMRAMQKSAELKKLPFILLSGHIQNSIRLSAARAGAADFFVKPINLDLLEETIRTRIAESERTDGGS